MLLPRFSCSFNSFRAWLSDHYQPDRLVHMCKIDTFDPDRNNRHKQNQELGWSSCIMNIFRKLFKFRTFQGETWKINDERGKLLMNTSACSAIQGFVRISTDFSVSASYYTRRRLKFVDVNQIWWRICLSRFGKRSATTMMKFSRNSKARAFLKTILKLRNQRIVFCLSWKSFAEMFSLLLHNSFESRIYWLFSVAWKCRLRKLFPCFLLRAPSRLIENIANRKSSLVQVKIHIADAHFERYIGLSSFLACFPLYLIFIRWMKRF